VDLDAFRACLAACRHPVHYNGDIRTRRDLDRLRRAFPGVTGWMLGRGVVTDPFLPRRWRGDRAPRSLERLHAFLEDYTTQSREDLSGPSPLLGRLKELWGYLHTLFANGERLWKAIRTSRRPEEYERVVAAWFQHDAELIEPTDGLPPAEINPRPPCGRPD
jgi:tRNA-dihydrouridine synthase